MWLRLTSRCAPIPRLCGRECDSRLTECIEMLRVDRKTVALLIFIPIGYALIFGGLFHRDSLTDLPIIVCNLDDGSLGRRLVRDLHDTPEIRVVEVNGSPLDIERRMLELKTFGAVVIPQDFSRQLNTGNSASLELIGNNVNQTLGSAAARAVQSVVGNLNAEVAIKQRLAVGWNAAEAQSTRLTVSSRVLFNPTGSYEDFFLAILIVHSAQIAVVFAIAPHIVNERHDETRPIDKPLQFLLTRLLAYASIEIATVCICLAIAIGVFKIKCLGNPSEIVMLIAAFVNPVYRRNLTAHFDG